MADPKDAEIARYEITGYDWETEVAHEGEWVQYSDHATEIARLKTEIERLGRDLNRAKYGEPDFSWAIHKEAMFELQSRAEKAESYGLKLGFREKYHDFTF